MTVKPSNIILTTIKSGFGAVVVNGRPCRFGLKLLDEIYVCGGNDGNTMLKVLEKYSFKTQQWAQLPLMKSKRDELAVTIGPDQKIYAIGGFGGPNKYY
jgi:hypothetical protein